MSTKSEAETALHEALSVLGKTTTEAAKALGENQSTVSMWIMRKQVSAGAARKVAEASGVSVHRLRRDIFGPAPEQRAA